MNLEVGKKTTLGKQGDRGKQGGIAHTDCGHQIIWEDTDLGLGEMQIACCVKSLTWVTFFFAC